MNLRTQLCFKGYVYLPSEYETTDRDQILFRA